MGNVQRKVFDKVVHGGRNITTDHDENDGLLHREHGEHAPPKMNVGLWIGIGIGALIILGILTGLR